VPRAAIEDVLRRLRIRPRWVVPADAGDIDMAAAFTPRWVLRAWSWILPLTGLIVAVAVLAYQDLAQRQAIVDELEQRAAALTTQTKALTEQEAKRQATMDGQAIVDKLVDQSPSSYLRLEVLRQRLPAQTKIDRLDLRGAELRVTVRSKNVLADVQTLAKQPGWISSVDGAITTDPNSGLEVATILLTGAGS
jgi:Tfp pilus assembly protein PilN